MRFLCFVLMLALAGTASAQCAGTVVFPTSGVQVFRGAAHVDPLTGLDSTGAIFFTPTFSYVAPYVPGDTWIHVPSYPTLNPVYVSGPMESVGHHPVPIIAPVWEDGFSLTPSTPGMSLLRTFFFFKASEQSTQLNSGGAGGVHPINGLTLNSPTIITMFMAPTPGPLTGTNTVGLGDLWMGMPFAAQYIIDPSAWTDTIGFPVSASTPRTQSINITIDEVFSTSCVAGLAGMSFVVQSIRNMPDSQVIGQTWGIEVLSPTTVTL